MKVYRVVKPFFDVDHDDGLYRSPLFSSKEVAEEFLSKVWGPNVPPGNKWWSAPDWKGEDHPPKIEEKEVLEECPEVKDAEHYLTITYT